GRSRERSAKSGDRCWINLPWPDRTPTEQIGRLEKQVHIEATRDDNARRLQTMPGIGPKTAMAVSAFAPPMEIFRRGRVFSAWVGLVPKQHSTAGKQKLGRTSKMGQRDIRRLLVTGAMSVVKVAVHKGAPGRLC
ncbi:transposase, partial [Leisingera sp.]|uniref:transposase n=1 Tax=Leisingera sp. TaxID=1879318 RepID=UPI003A5BD7C3